MENHPRLLLQYYDIASVSKAFISYRDVGIFKDDSAHSHPYPNGLLKSRLSQSARPTRTRSTFPETRLKANVLSPRATTHNNCVDHVNWYDRRLQLDGAEWRLL